MFKLSFLNVVSVNMLGVDCYSFFACLLLIVLLLFCYHLLLFNWSNSQEREIEIDILIRTGDLVLVNCPEKLQTKSPGLKLKMIYEVYYSSASFVITFCYTCRFLYLQLIQMHLLMFWTILFWISSTIWYFTWCSFLLVALTILVSLSLHSGIYLSLLKYRWLRSCLQL